MRPLAPPASARPRSEPTLARRIANFGAFQLAWFAAVLGAARSAPAWGTACVAAVIAWHVLVSARPAREAQLVACVCLVGVVFESLVVAQGHVQYASGQLAPLLPPFWIIALWGLLAITLNVTLRWLKRRPWLCAALGALAGPASFLAGARLGAARLVDPVPAIVTLGFGWAVLLPLLMALSNHFDGVRASEAAHA